MAFNFNFNFLFSSAIGLPFNYSSVSCLSLFSPCRLMGKENKLLHAFEATFKKYMLNGRNLLEETGCPGEINLSIISSSSSSS